MKKIILSLSLDKDAKILLSALIILALMLSVGGSIIIVLNVLEVKTGIDTLSPYIFLITGLAFGLIAHFVYEHLKKGMK